MFIDPLNREQSILEPMFLAYMFVRLRSQRNTSTTNCTFFETGHLVTLVAAVYV